jgi:hypothetical protein
MSRPLQQDQDQIQDQDQAHNQAHNHDQVHNQDQAYNQAHNHDQVHNQDQAHNQDQVHNQAHNQAYNHDQIQDQTQAQYLGQFVIGFIRNLVCRNGSIIKIPDDYYAYGDPSFLESIITTDLVGRIFRKGFKKFDVFFTNLNNFCAFIPFIKDSRKSYGIPKYNIYLSKIHTLLENNLEDNLEYENDIHVKNIILNIASYNKNGTFAIKSKNFGKFIGGTNYDGHSIDNEKIIINVPKSRLTTENTFGPQSKGVSFAFYSREVLFTMLKVGIENATTQQLVIESINSVSSYSTKVGGYIKCHTTIFSINLLLPHCNRVALLNTTSTKIIPHLLYIGLHNDKVKTLLANFNGKTTNIIELGDYIKFHEIVYNKIHHLINMSFSVPEFEYISITCYRPECMCKNIFRKQLVNDLERASLCKICKIAEFCTACGNPSHCGNCNTSEEIAGDEWISLNTKKCPSCNVPIQRDEGCNHMHCTQCDVHFCWLCRETYLLENIRDHYTVSDDNDENDNNPNYRIYGDICVGLFR